LQSGAQALGRGPLERAKGMIDVGRIVLGVRSSDAVRFPPERF
jgi:hypothetical protein